jgi:hypothetical protein
LIGPEVTSPEVTSPEVTSRPDRDLVAPTDAELRRRYAAYRLGQARSLVGMMPRAAVRPLYRRARRADTDCDDSDPLRELVDFCERLLPLPPFEVWLRDLDQHPDAHLTDLDNAVNTPGPTSPATLEARALRRLEREWIVRLKGFRDREVWRGFIAFEDSATGQVHRTALIFREAGPADLRERFLSFESAALGAFLRSALP